MNNAINDDCLMHVFAVLTFKSQIKDTVSAQPPSTAINHVREMGRPGAVCSKMVCAVTLDVPLSDEQAATR